MILEAYEYPHATAKGKSFSVWNNISYSNDDPNADRQACAQITYMGTDFREEPDMLPFRRIEDAASVPAALIGKTSMPPKEARAAVEALLAKAGLAEIVVTGLYYPDMAYKNALWDMAPMHGYIVSCSETYCGVPVATLQGEASGQPDEEGVPFRCWNYQAHYYYVDETGVRFVRWASPYANEETLAEHVKMLPFTEIQGIFGRIAEVKFTPGEGVASVTLSVDRIALELFRVREHDSLERGLLIPVWNYYGSYRVTYADGHAWSTDSRQGFPTPLLTINAVDGSVIDPGTGY